MSIDDRESQRADVQTVVRLRSPTLADFIEKHSEDLSATGVFVRSDEPMAKATLVKVQLVVDEEDGDTYVEAVGRVVWTRSLDEATDAQPAGMGIKFVRVEEEGRDRIRSLVESHGGRPSNYDLGAPADDDPDEPETAEPGPAEPEPSKSAAPGEAKAVEPDEPEAPEREPAKPETAEAEPTAKGRRERKDPARKAETGRSRPDRDSPTKGRPKKARASTKKAKKGSSKRKARGDARAPRSEARRSGDAVDYGWTDAVTWPLLAVLLLVVVVAVYLIFFQN
ncbi:MAG: PilZ domain-containing protein [Sandaracinaceae bacterium]